VSDEDSQNMQEIRIHLKRAPGEPPENDPGFQKELGTFSSTLYAAGIRHSQLGKAFDPAAAAGYPLPEFIITEPGPAAIGVIGTAAGAWISARHGRRMCLTAGGIEVEARTLREIDQLLQRAYALQTGQTEASDET
jgi:hypothetical protein